MALEDGRWISGRQKRFITNDQFQDTRIKTETRNQNQPRSQNDISGSCCKAQQRLMNLTNSKIKDAQPKLLNNPSIGKSLDDSESPFIYKVQNFKRNSASKSERELSHVVLKQNGYYQNHFDNIKKAIENNSKNPNENFNNEPQSSNRKKKCDNSIIDTNRKMKSSIPCEKDSSRIKSNNSTSENADSKDSTLKRFQQWYVKNEPAVSKSCTGFEQITAKSRRLTISEVLQMHERDNEMNHANKSDGSVKNNVSKDNFFSSSKDNLPKVENLKISELQENFLVEKLESPMKSSKNLCVEDKIDCDNHVSSFRADDIISEFLSYDVSPRFTDLPNNRSSSRHGSSRSRNCSNDQRYSISTENNKTDNIQKSPRYTESESDMRKQKRDGSTENNFKDLRNLTYNCNKSKSLFSLDCSYERNNNKFISPTKKNHSTEKIRYPKATFGSSENLFTFQKNYSVDTPKKSFISEEQDAIRNKTGFKQFPRRNHQSESRRFTRNSESISSRSSSSSKLPNCNNDKTCSDPRLPIRNYSNVKKLPNLKIMAYKSDVDFSNQNSCDQSMPWDGFQQKRQNKYLSSRNGSASTSVNLSHKELNKIFRLESSKELIKKYNTSNRQQTFKYAKNHSDFNKILKSSYKNPVGNQDYCISGQDASQNYSCLAQQRLSSCKLSKI